MLIIIGTNDKHKEVSHLNSAGAFCKICNGRLKYIETSRWLTLFFIPVYKIKTLGSYYQCAICKAQFNEIF